MKKTLVSYKTIRDQKSRLINYHLSKTSIEVLGTEKCKNFSVSKYKAEQLAEGSCGAI